MARQTIVVHYAKSYLSDQQEKQASEAPKTASASPLSLSKHRKGKAAVGPGGLGHCPSERVVVKIESNITSHDGKLCSAMPPKVNKS